MNKFILNSLKINSKMGNVFVIFKYRELVAKLFRRLRNPISSTLPAIYILCCNIGAIITLFCGANDAMKLA